MRMKFNNLNKFIINFFLISLFTFLVFEIALTFLLSQKGKNKNLESIQYSNKLSDLVHESNLNKKFFRTIIGNQPNLYKKEIEFKTDSIGAILPSSFDNISSNENYILFCGGSTTEASQVDMNKRPTDVFTRISGIKSINLAKSGKTLNGCISTIKNYILMIENHHKEIPYPTNYVIATNYNALMEFGRYEYKKNEYIKKNSLYRSNLIKLISKIINKRYLNFLFGINISTYEHALLEGCCFGASQINSKELSPRVINWEDDKVKISYKNFLNKSFNELNNYLNKMGISNNKIFLAIEPNSFNIKYDKLFRSYWKGFDSRHVLKSYEGDKLSLINSSNILKEFNQIYIDAAILNNFQIIIQELDKIPDFSFYDSVHTTDTGSEFIGKTYADNIKIKK